MLARILDELHSFEVKKLSRAARALLKAHKLDIGRARFRHGLFFDAYVALAPRSRRVTVQRQTTICSLFLDPCTSWSSPATSPRSTSSKPSAAA